MLQQIAACIICKMYDVQNNKYIPTHEKYLQTGVSINMQNNTQFSKFDIDENPSRNEHWY
jgi:hypothetical protein